MATSTFHVHSPSQEQDLLKNMRRPDLYQWADEIGIEYPPDAAAVTMRAIIRGSGRLPDADRFLLDKRGNPTTYKRLPRSRAPKSKHEARDRAKAAKERDRQWEKYLAMDHNDLKKIVKNQLGPKSVEDEPSREYMITRLVGPRIKIDADTQAVPEESSVKIPDVVLNMLSPMQLVKYAREQLGLEDVQLKDGKEVLLEKIRAA